MRDEQAFQAKYMVQRRQGRQGNILRSQQLGLAKSKKQRAAEDTGGRQKSDQRVPCVSLTSSNFILQALGCHALFVNLVTEWGLHFREFTLTAVWREDLSQMGKVPVRMLSYLLSSEKVNTCRQKCDFILIFGRSYIYGNIYSSNSYLEIITKRAIQFSGHSTSIHSQSQLITSELYPSECFKIINIFVLKISF